MNINTHKHRVLYLRVWRAHTHIRNSQPYQLHASTHVLIALKVDVIRPENIQFAAASVKLSAWKFYRLGQ